MLLRPFYLFLSSYDSTLHIIMLLAQSQQKSTIAPKRPNGSGKTTIASKILHHEWLENALYINPDIITQEEFGDWNRPEIFLKN